MGLVRVYTKKPGWFPDFKDPIILSDVRGGTTIKNLLTKIHKNMESEFKYAHIWGKSVKFSPQKWGLHH